MFKNIDTDGSGTITFDELRTGLHRLGSKLTESEIKQLMEAVRRKDITNPLGGIIKHFKRNQKLITLLISFLFIG